MAPERLKKSFDPKNIKQVWFQFIDQRLCRLFTIFCPHISTLWQFYMRPAKTRVQDNQGYECEEKIFAYKILVMWASKQWDFRFLEVCKLKPEKYLSRRLDEGQWCLSNRWNSQLFSGCWELIALSTSIKGLDYTCMGGIPPHRVSAAVYNSLFYSFTWFPCVK